MGETNLATIHAEREKREGRGQHSNSTAKHEGRRKRREIVLHYTILLYLAYFARSNGCRGTEEKEKWNNTGKMAKENKAENTMMHRLPLAYVQKCRHSEGERSPHAPGPPNTTPAQTEAPKRKSHPPPETTNKTQTTQGETDPKSQANDK